MKLNPPYLPWNSISTHERISIASYMSLLCNCAISGQTNQKCDYANFDQSNLYVCMSSVILIDEELPYLETKSYGYGSR
jgi:hypothetical protein